MALSGVIHWCPTLHPSQAYILLYFCTFEALDLKYFGLVSQLLYFCTFVLFEVLKILWPGVPPCSHLKLLTLCTLILLTFEVLEILWHAVPPSSHQAFVLLYFLRYLRYCGLVWCPTLLPSQAFVRDSCHDGWPLPCCSNTLAYIHHRTTLHISHCKEARKTAVLMQGT